MAPETPKTEEEAQALVDDPVRASAYLRSQKDPRAYLRRIMLASLIASKPPEVKLTPFRMIRLQIDVILTEDKMYTDAGSMEKHTDYSTFVERFGAALDWITSGGKTKKKQRV
jgi:hypothetical protein